MSQLERSRSFRRRAEACFQSLTGVGLPKLSEAFARTGKDLGVEMFMARALEPRDYAMVAIASLGLDYTSVDRVSRNKSISKVLRLQAKDERWMVGPDGSAYMETDRGVMRALACKVGVFSRDSRFKVQLSDGASLRGDVAAGSFEVVGGTEFTDIYEGPDLADGLASARERWEQPAGEFGLYGYGAQAPWCETSQDAGADEVRGSARPAEQETGLYGYGPSPW